ADGCVRQHGGAVHYTYHCSMFHIPATFIFFATPDQYAEMIDAAKTGAYAYPAINVTSSQTLNAALRGFAEAESDGIIQVSNGGAKYFSGSNIEDMVTGSLAFAAFAREVAKNYGVRIALHT